MPDLPTNLEQLKDKVMDSFPPSNQQIESSLNEMKDTLEKEKGTLDDRGKTIVSDTENLIDTTLKTLHEKNKNETIQKLFFDTKEMVDNNAPVLEKEVKKIKTEGKDIGKKYEKAAASIPKGSPHPQKLKSESKQLYYYIKNLLWNFLRSEDFRSLASEWIAFFQFLGTKKIKEQAKKLEGEGGLKEEIAKTVDEGLEEMPKPADEEELKRKPSICSNLF